MKILTVFAFTVVRSIEDPNNVGIRTVVQTTPTLYTGELSEFEVAFRNYVQIPSTYGDRELAKVLYSYEVPTVIADAISSELSVRGHSMQLARLKDTLIAHNMRYPGVTVMRDSNLAKEYHVTNPPESW